MSNLWSKKKIETETKCQTTTYKGTMELAVFYNLCITQEDSKDAN